MESGILKAIKVVVGVAGILAVAGGAWFGYAMWSRHVARSTLEEAGVPYSEASFIERACHGDEVAVLLFLKGGMSPNVQGVDGSTPLGCLLRSRKNDLIALLLAKGANINAKTKFGQTPLMEAAKSASLDEMQALIAAGAAVNSSDDSGNTPLLLASGAWCSTPDCNQKAVELLLAHGADPKVVNRNGETVLSRLIMRNRNTDFAKLSALLNRLIKAGADINASTVNGQPLLAYAALQGNLDLLNNLVSLGADVNIVGKRSTPLISAVKRPQELKLLLDNKADPNLADESGNTPLVAAVDQRSIDSVELLLDSGAKVEPPQLAPTSALHEAARLGDLDIVTLLLKHPVDVNGKDAKGSTPLHVLAQNSYGDPPVRVEIAKMLMRYGANPRLLDRYGNKPFVLAIRANALNLASVLAGRKITRKYLSQHPELRPNNLRLPFTIGHGAGFSGRSY